MTTRALLLVMTASLLLTGCGSGPAAGPATGSSPATATPSASTPVASASSTTPAAPVDTAASAMGKRCGTPYAPSTLTTLKGPDGAELALGTVGTGPTVALLLHQSGQPASCGWWTYAVRMAAAGLRVALLDLCGYGRSTCDVEKPFNADHPAQVKLAVDALRADGATRVTLVGASLGGKVASISAGPVKADALVNLSGDPGTTQNPDPMARLTIPILGAGSEAESPDTDKLQKAVEGSPSATKRVIRVKSGHGWDMMSAGPFPTDPLSPLGAAVVEWAKGNYAG